MIKDFTKWVESRKNNTLNEDLGATGGNQGSFGSFDTQQHPEELGGAQDYQIQHAQQLEQELQVLDGIGKMCDVQQGMSDTLTHTLNQIGGMIGVAKQQLYDRF